MLVFHEITGIAAILCKSLKGHSTLMCNQHHTLKRLVLDINSKIGIVGSLSEVQRDAISKETHQLSDSCDYVVPFVAVRGFMEDLGFFVKDCLAAMDNGNCDTLLQLSEATILVLVDGISAVVVERNEGNEAYIDAAPSVLPHQIVRILPRDFSVYLQCHWESLDYTFSIEEIENIRRQHKALYDLNRLQPDVKISIDIFYEGDAYRYAWNGLNNMYPLMERFVGSLETIFPGTSTVESDFSVVNDEKNRNQMCLSNASLEGVLRASSTGLCAA